MKSAIQLIQEGASLIRFTSGDENLTFMGSYWAMPDQSIEKSTDRYNYEDASKIVQSCTGGAGNVSDGYHTFNELYGHRIALFIALCNLMPDNCHKTKLNFEQEMWEGWFILQCDHPIAGQMSYHIPDHKWELCRVKEVDFNYNYDGHTSQDVLERLSRI